MVVDWADSRGNRRCNGLWCVRMVVDARARARCTCNEEGGRKGTRCVCILCCMSLGWADSKRSVEYIWLERIPR